MVTLETLLAVGGASVRLVHDLTNCVHMWRQHGCRPAIHATLGCSNPELMAWRRTVGGANRQFQPGADL